VVVEVEDTNEEITDDIELEVPDALDELVDTAPPGKTRVVVGVDVGATSVWSVRHSFCVPLTYNS
jgi:hypothetical protein